MRLSKYAAKQLRKALEVEPEPLPANARALVEAKAAELGATKIRYVFNDHTSIRLGSRRVGVITPLELNGCPVAYYGYAMNTLFYRYAR
jgi:hypothetical protein